MKKKDMEDDKEKNTQTPEEKVSEENSVQNNSFWKKLGSAVKKAVDCCLE